MVGPIFMALVALSLAVAGLGLLVWWLWQLWGQREEETTVQAIEIKAQPPTIEPEPPRLEVEPEQPLVEAKVEAPIPISEEETLEIKKGTPVEKVAVAASAAELGTRADEVNVEEPAAEMAAEAEEMEAAAEEPAAPAKPDDLKRIEGIGPKIANVLQAGGILTYVQLADSDPAQLRQILEESDPRLLRIAHPDTWPEQASLAASGDWDGLQALQGRLKGGKRA